MPGIVVFNRRWMVASDDFVIPFGFAFVLRGLWMITLSLAVGIYHGFYHSHNVDDHDRHVCEQTLDYFMGGYLALLFATNIMELSIAWMSGKGSIMDTEPRNLIPQLLYVRLVLNIIELLWLSIGVKWIFIDVNICTLTPEIYIARAIVVFNWLFLFSMLAIVYCTFDSAGKTWVRFKDARLTGDCVDASEGYSRHITYNYQKQWEGCFRKCCCCSGVGRGDENVFTTIGRTLAEYFHDIDVVPSDFAAGLALLRKYQKHQENVALMRAIEEQQVLDSQKGVKKSSLRFQRTNSARTLNLKNKGELLLFKDVVYYMNYALSAYGWPIYVKKNSSFGCCKLLKNVRCCYTCRSPDQRSHKFVDVESDNCCRCNYSALKRIASIHNRDVIYVSYHNKLYETPFFVCMDHDKRAVVVTIRGTLSLQDILTDFSVEAERLPLEGGDPDWFAHKGFMKAALYIKKKLEGGILTRAFHSDPDRHTESYRLMIVGHSLGAGAAAILAILLRPYYPDLFCYAYSPPGANLSLSAAKYTRDFVISVVIGKDMIPRLSLNTLEDLRNKMLAVISHSTTPKWKILRGCACRCAFVCCYGCKCVKFESEEQETDEDWENFEVPRYKSFLTRNFYPPGKVIHVVKTVSVPTRCGRKRKLYEPVWADLEDFQSLEISSLMWEDHYPDFVLDALNQCLPSKEQEEIVLNAPPQPSPKTLEVPISELRQNNHIHRELNHKQTNARSSGSLREAEVIQEGNEVELPLERITSFDSLSPEVNHPLWRLTALVSEARKAPIARPESGFDDSDLDDSLVSSRVSANWKGLTLPSVWQSTDKVVDIHPRPRANTDIGDLSPDSQRSLKTLDDLTDKTFSAGSMQSFVSLQRNIPPPPKPPRTFETERSEGRESFRYKPPPKPPRTFEYESQIQANFSSSLYWHFPRPHNRVIQTQISSPELDGSTISTELLDGQESEEVLPPYNPHRSKLPQFYSTSQNGEVEVYVDDALPLHNSAKASLFSTVSTHHNGDAIRRPKRRSIESPGPESRHSISDSGLNISQEEMFLLGSVKPRGGRRKKRKALKHTTSETLRHVRGSIEENQQLLDSPRIDRSFLETTL